MRPHRRQPTRLPCPWGSPGKNTGVGCHFLLQCMRVKSESEVAQSHPTLCNPMDYSLPGSSIHGIFQARVLEWTDTAFSTAGTRHSRLQVPKKTTRADILFRPRAAWRTCMSSIVTITTALISEDRLQVKWISLTLPHSFRNLEKQGSRVSYPDSIPVQS